MTNGTSQGLFVIVAVVIFGIFVAISYTIFRGSLQPALANIFKDSLTQAKDSLEGNPLEDPLDKIYTDEDKQVKLGYEKTFKFDTDLVENPLKRKYKLGSYTFGGYGGTLDEHLLFKDIKEVETKIYSFNAVVEGSVEDFNNKISEIEGDVVSYLNSFDKQTLKTYITREYNFKHKLGIENEKITSLKVNGREIADSFEQTGVRVTSDGFKKTMFYEEKGNPEDIVDIPYSNVMVEHNINKNSGKEDTAHVNDKFFVDVIVQDEQAVFKVYAESDMVSVELSSGRKYSFEAKPYFEIVVDRVLEVTP